MNSISIQIYYKFTLLFDNITSNYLLLGLENVNYSCKTFDYQFNILFYSVCLTIIYQSDLGTRYS